MKKSKSLYEAIKVIRELINKAIKQHFLIQDKPKWNQFLSSLYVIEDSDLAIRAYESLTEVSEVGIKYLTLYGLLQALFLQQNAVEHLCEALGVNASYKNYPKLKEVRKTRNVSTGHPTKKESKGKKSFHFISRDSLAKTGFDLLSFSEKEDGKHSEISISNLIAEQRKFLPEILDKVTKELYKEENEFKKKYENDKLSSTMPEMLHYYITKLYELTLGTPQPIIIIEKEFNRIQNAFAKLKEKLADRGLSIDTYGSISEIYSSVEHPLKTLKIFLACKKQDKKLNIDDQTAYIFVYFLDNKIKELRETLKEIDQEMNDEKK